MSFYLFYGWRTVKCSKCMRYVTGLMNFVNCGAKKAVCSLISPACVRACVRVRNVHAGLRQRIVECILITLSSCRFSRCRTSRGRAKKKYITETCQWIGAFELFNRSSCHTAKYLRSLRKKRSLNCTKNTKNTKKLFRGIRAIVHGYSLFAGGLRT
jgi:hypothetical protein